MRLSRVRRLRCPLVGILTAAVRAVAALGHVQECMNVGIQLGHPVARHQERRQVEQIHKHFVAITAGKKKNKTKQSTDLSVLSFLEVETQQPRGPHPVQPFTCSRNMTSVYSEV